MRFSVDASKSCRIMAHEDSHSGSEDHFNGLLLSSFVPLVELMRLLLYMLDDPSVTHPQWFGKSRKVVAQDMARQVHGCRPFSST